MSNLKKRILNEMVMSDKDMAIKELVDLRIWDKARIERRWNRLEKLDKITAKTERSKE